MPPDQEPPRVKTVMSNVMMLWKYADQDAARITDVAEQLTDFLLVDGAHVVHALLNPEDNEQRYIAFNIKRRVEDIEGKRHDWLHWHVMKGEKVIEHGTRRVWIPSKPSPLRLVS